MGGRDYTDRKTSGKVSEDKKREGTHCIHKDVGKYR